MSRSGEPPRGHLKMMILFATGNAWETKPSFWGETKFFIGDENFYVCWCILTSWDLIRKKSQDEEFSFRHIVQNVTFERHMTKTPQPLVRVTWIHFLHINGQIKMWLKYISLGTRVRRCFPGTVLFYWIAAVTSRCSEIRPCLKFDWLIRCIQYSVCQYFAVQMGAWLIDLRVFRKICLVGLIYW